MKLGIIVGRFQSPIFHDGYKFLFQKALKECDMFYIILGDTGLPGTRRNPFSVKERTKMITDHLGEFGSDVCYGITSIRDMKSDVKWSEKLDSIIDAIDTVPQIAGDSRDSVLIGSRDSFLKVYSGKHKTLTIQPELQNSATDIRNETIKNLNKFPVSYDYMIGKMAGIYEQFPKTHPTVDIAILDGKGNILLGRKPNENLFRFPGGFVDVTDKNLEQAAHRETLEECGDIEVGDFKYVGSYSVNDWRYHAGPDRILTTLFSCTYQWGQVKGSDDLAEVEWFNIDSVKHEDLVGEHRAMFLDLVNKLAKNKI